MTTRPFKPFKPPSLLNRPTLPNIHAEPPRKKRRISEDAEDSDEDATTEAAARFAAARKLSQPVKTFVPHRVPLKEVGNQSSSQSQNLPPSTDRDEKPGHEAYYIVLYRKFTTKKHKTWDGDGVLSVVGGYARLQDVDGRELGRTPCKTPLLPESQLSVGGKEVEIDSVITKGDYLAGKPFLQTKQVEKPKPIKTPSKSIKKRVTSDTSSDGAVPVLPASSQPSGPKFKKHVLQRKPSVDTTIIKKEPLPRHDPNTPGAILMKRPASVPKGKQIVDVVVDPFLGHHLRPHQQEGVKFLYECVMGMRESGEGAILADEMGLGKTLQTIALIWTLLKQNPVFEDQPVAKKIMIVCPVTLAANWRKEFRKWLGLDRIGVFVVDNDKRSRLTDFTKGKAYPVMIIGYEKLRLVQDELKGANIDLVIADEGHRLKTAQNKSAAAIKELGTEKRIILSGTPLQNDLSEFWTMVDFVNPGLLGKYNVFKREFETPIIQSRQPNATSRNIEKGTARSEELARLTSQFILRRTSEVIAKFLPPKTETVLFIQPTEPQARLYKAILDSPMYGSVLGSNEAALALITYLKKLCNSPNLLTKQYGDEGSSNKNVAALLDSIPPEHVNGGKGAKLKVLEDLLLNVRNTTDDKVVLVSNYTSTLDALQTVLAANGMSWGRLDGSTPAAKRQGLVDRFNNSSPKNQFAFLLSAKAGGVGLNLIGASRLVLFDVDWNPATDLQAMARIHRDGQKKPCYIYRFLIKGAIDEKIFQRQVTKTGLADAIVDSKKTGQHFTHDELRALFRLDEGEACQSSEYLTGMGFVDVTAVEDEETFEDEALKARLQAGGSCSIPYVFAKTTS